jgi:hypothetical protein
MGYLCWGGIFLQTKKRPESVRAATVLQPAESATFGCRPQSFMTEVSSPASHNPHVGAAEGCDLDRSHAPRGSASWDALRPVTRSVTGCIPTQSVGMIRSKDRSLRQLLHGRFVLGREFSADKKSPRINQGSNSAAARGIRDIRSQVAKFHDRSFISSLTQSPCRSCRRRRF